MNPITLAMCAICRRCDCDGHNCSYSNDGIDKCDQPAECYVYFHTDYPALSPMLVCDMHAGHLEAEASWIKTEEL